MKFVRYLSIGLSLAVLAGCSSGPEPKSMDTGPAIDAPVTMNDAKLSVTVSDLPGFLDEAGQVAAQVSPMINGTMLKMMLGSKVGDPQLTGIAPSNGLAVVMMSETNFFAVLEVAPALADTYTQSLQGLGLLAEMQDDLLVVAMDSEQLAAAKPLASTVQAELLAADRSASLRVAVRASDVVSSYEPMINAGLEKMLAEMKQGMAAAGEPMDVSKVLEAEVTVLLSLARQVDAYELVVLPVDGGIHTEETIQPVAGSRLAAYCDAPAEQDWNSEISSGLLPEKSMFEFEGCLRRPAALQSFVHGEVDNLVQSMGIDSSVKDDWNAYMDRWFDAMGSTFCESIFSADDNPFGFAVFCDVVDEDAMLEAYRTMSDDLEAIGLFTFYESMGMPLSMVFEENADSYSGVSIHNFKMNYDLSGMTSEETAMMKSMLGDMTYRLAIHDGVMAASYDSSTMQSAINKLQGGVVPPSQMAARDVFPAGGIFYADLDVGAYFAFASSLVPAGVPQGGAVQMMDMIGTTLEGADPIVFSAYCNSGRFKFCSQISPVLIARIAQAAQLAAMNAMMDSSAMSSPDESANGPAPEVSLTMMDGTSVSLSSLEGKVVLLDFFATWCGPCRNGLPKVQAVADHFAGSDVLVYAVNMQEDAETVKSFFDEAGLSLTVALDDGPVSEAFGVNGIPHSVLIGKDGVIKAVHVGLSPDLDAQLMAEINNALAE